MSSRNQVNSPSDAEVIIQKLPSDMGVHRNPRKGTLNAPEKILEGLEFDMSVLVEEVFPVIEYMRILSSSRNLVGLLFR
jgi:hypothetical protein